jgi:ribosome-associated protein
VTTKKSSKKNSAKTATLRKPAAKTTGKSDRSKKTPVKKPATKKRSAPPRVEGSATTDKARRQTLASAKIAMAAAMEKKGIEPILIDVCGQSSYADFIGVVSGQSDRQVDAIAEYICEVMSDHGHRVLSKEGMRTGRWVLLDFGDVVVHIFYQPLRNVFDIESLWIDAPRVKLATSASARSDFQP